jgi:hypothetical protein
LGKGDIQERIDSVSEEAERRGDEARKQLQIPHMLILQSAQRKKIWPVLPVKIFRCPSVHAGQRIPIGCTEQGPQQGQEQLPKERGAHGQRVRQVDTWLGHHVCTMEENNVPDRSIHCQLQLPSLGQKITKSLCRLKIKYEKRINLDFHFGIKRGMLASNCETIWFGFGCRRFFYANFLILSMRDALAGTQSLKNLCRGSSLGWMPEWKEIFEKKAQEYCNRRIVRI